MRITERSTMVFESLLKYFSPKSYSWETIWLFVVVDLTSKANSWPKALKIDIIGFVSSILSFFFRGALAQIGAEKLRSPTDPHLYPSLPLYSFDPVKSRKRDGNWRMLLIMQTQVFSGEITGRIDCPCIYQAIREYSQTTSYLQSYVLYWENYRREFLLLQ